MSTPAVCTKRNSISNPKRRSSKSGIVLTPDGFINNKLKISLLYDKYLVGQTVGIGADSVVKLAQVRHNVPNNNNNNRSRRSSKSIKSIKSPSLLPVDQADTPRLPAPITTQNSQQSLRSLQSSSQPSSVPKSPKSPKSPKHGDISPTPQSIQSQSQSQSLDSTRSSQLAPPDLSNIASCSSLTSLAASTTSSTSSSVIANDADTADTADTSQTVLDHLNVNNHNNNNNNNNDNYNSNNSNSDEVRTRASSLDVSDALSDITLDTPEGYTSIEGQMSQECVFITDDENEQEIDLKGVNSDHDRKNKNNKNKPMYEIEHIETLRAIKCIDKSKLMKQQLSDLQSETAILKYIANYKHSNIVTFYESFEINGKLHIVTEYLAGDTLEARVVNSFNYANIPNPDLKKGPITENDSKIIMYQLLSALECIHKLNIVHRDIKPDNIVFVNNKLGDNNIKLIDFGIATMIINPNDDSSNDLGLGLEIDLVDELSRACGTPLYMAPEIIRKDQYDTKIDMWAAGLILWFMLCGYLPFRLKPTDQVNVLCKQILAARFPMLSPQWYNVSIFAKDLIRKLLCREPNQRLSASQALKHRWFRNLKM